MISYLACKNDYMRFSDYYFLFFKQILLLFFMFNCVLIPNRETEMCFINKIGNTQRTNLPVSIADRNWESSM